MSINTKNIFYKEITDKTMIIIVANYNVRFIATIKIIQMGIHVTFNCGVISPQID